MSLERQVSAHYTRDRLEQRILGALEKSGKDLKSLTSDDLAPLDNFHVGERSAIQELAGFIALRPGTHLLDVGCGIGGPARFFAERGYQVTGIDLSEEFVRVAESLTRRLKLEGKAQYRQGSALEMPFSSGRFDGAYMIHVGMNIQDKAGVFREVARLVKPGGQFAIFDIMKTGSQPLDYPLPWAVNAETSFVGTAEDYRSKLEAAGFRVEHQRGRRAVCGGIYGEDEGAGCGWRAASHRSTSPDGRASAGDAEERERRHRRWKAGTTGDSSSRWLRLTLERRPRAFIRSRRPKIFPAAR